MNGGDIGYRNSGLGRYGSGLLNYQPTPYQPAIFSPPTLGPRMTMPGNTGGLPGGGQLSPTQTGLGGGAATSGPAGGSGTVGQLGQIGLAGLMGGIPGLAGALGGIAANGAPANGAAVNAVAQGDPVAADNAVSQAEANDSTNPSSVNAVNGMDAASDAAGGGGSGK